MLLSLSAIWPLWVFPLGMPGFCAHSGPAFILQQDIARNGKVFSSPWLFYEPASNHVPASPGKTAANFVPHLLGLPWVSRMEDF